MRLEKLSLAGYMAISPGRPVELEFSPKMNVLIGPNNAGKSALFRFLHSLLRNGERNDQFTSQMQIDWTQGYFWKYNLTQPVLASAQLICDPNVIRHRDLVTENVLKDGAFGIDMIVDNTGDAVGVKASTLRIMPHVFIDGKLTPYMQKVKGELLYVSQRDGIYTGTFSHALAKQASPLLDSWCDSMRFFDPIRALDRVAGRRKMDDGSDLVKDLYELSHDPRLTHIWESFRESMLQQLNGLLQPSGVATIRDFEFKSETDLYFRMKNLAVPIESLGTGISQLFLICSSLILDLNRHMQYFIEEPESHLHPGLLKRLIAHLRTFPNIQYFITTHSNVILDCLSEEDRAFDVRQDADGECVITSCVEFTHKHAVLDRLGISGGSLLQSNCAIWVEGPSDRLYVRKWLNDLAAEKGETLIEESDYSFVYYGGKILSHFALDDESVGDLISMLKISRFSAVLMDRDSEAGKSLKANSAKQRIESEAKSDAIHRLAMVTDGREVENELPIEAIMSAVVSLLGVDATKVASLLLSSKEKYGVEIATHLRLTGDQHKQAVSKLHKKVDFAQAVLSSYSGAWSVRPAYIEQLYQLIERGPHTGQGAGVNHNVNTAVVLATETTWFRHRAKSSSFRRFKQNRKHALKA